MNRRLPRKMGGPTIIAGALAIFLTACQAPDPHPFLQYAAAVKQAGDSLDQVLVQDTAWSRDEYINKVLDGSVDLRHTAILDERVPFTVIFPATGDVTNPPTFYKLQEIRATLLNLNSATEKYVKVLSTLAGTDLVNPATFASMANETDANLNAIATHLNAQVPGAAIKVFSLSSAEILQLVIEDKRQKALEHILTSNQACIDGYSQKSLTLLRILDQSLLTDYGNKAAAIEAEFKKFPADTRTDDPKARATVEQLLQLNSDYFTLVNSLKSAKRMYEALPQGHRDLLKSVLKQPTDLAAIKALYQEGQRLKQIYDGMQATPTPGKSK